MEYDSHGGVDGEGLTVVGKTLVEQTMTGNAFIKTLQNRLSSVRYLCT